MAHWIGYVLWLAFVGTIVVSILGGLVMAVINMIGAIIKPLPAAPRNLDPFNPLSTLRPFRPKRRRRRR